MAYDVRIVPAQGITSYTSSLSYLESVTQTPSGSLIYVGSGSTGRTDLLAVNGNQGRLFTVSDDLSNSLFSVNTIAGLPVIEAFADNTVNIGKFGAYSIQVPSAGNASLGSGSVLFVSASGNVGINTTNPGKQLSVANGNLQGQIYCDPKIMNIRSSDEITAGANTAIAFTVVGNGSYVNNAMFITSSGNVGIATNIPGYTLDVNGTCNIRSNLLVSGSLNVANYIIANNDFAWPPDPDGSTSSYQGYSPNLSAGPASVLEIIDVLSNAIGVGDPLRFATVQTKEKFIAGAWTADANNPNYELMFDGNVAHNVDVITFTEFNGSNITGKRFVVNMVSQFHRPNFLTIQSDFGSVFAGYSVMVETSNDASTWTKRGYNSTALNTARLLAFVLGDLGADQYIRFTFTLLQTLTDGQSLRVNRIRAYQSENYHSFFSDGPPVSTNYSGSLIVNKTVGIGGTTNPSYTKLVVSASVTSSWSNPGPTAYGGLHLVPGGVDQSWSGITFGGNANGLLTIANQSQAGIYVPSAGAFGTWMLFCTTDAFVGGAKTRMVIDQFGNVGVGNHITPGKFSSDSGLCLDLLNISGGGKSWLGVGGNQTSDSAVGDINFYNSAIGVGNDCRIVVLRGSRLGANNSGQFDIFTRNVGSYINAFTIVPAGSVGIMKQNPGATLDVSGSVRCITPTGNAGFIVGHDQKQWTLYPVGSDIRFFEYTTIIGTGGNDRITFKSGGNLGIGTTNPVVHLEVSASDGGNISVKTSGRYATGTSGTGGVWLDGGAAQFVGSYDSNTAGFYNNGWIFFASVTGKVGVGTNNSSPQSPLDVSGSLQIRGPVTQGGITFSDNTPTNKWKIVWDNVSNSLDFNFVG